MQVQIGQRGEIVIPKKIREKLGITPYTNLILNEEANGITLQPQQNQSSLARWKVFATEEVSKWDLTKEPYEDQD